jgi:DNA-binding NarL/FixJ family response regulator
VKAIRKVHEGEVWIERSRMASILNSITREKPADLSKLEVDRICLLSKRERQVVAFIGQMMKNQQIADQLGISEVTVRHHLTSIYSKLEVGGRLELLVFSHRHGLSKL